MADFNKAQMSCKLMFPRKNNILDQFITWNETLFAKEKLSHCDRISLVVDQAIAATASQGCVMLDCFLTEERSYRQYDSPKNFISEQLCIFNLHI